MARIDTLGNFLTDVADAIKNKKGDDTPILASEFDTEITNLPSGGSSHDWSVIGYNGEPKSLQEMFDYSKEIYDNWDNTIIDLNSKFSRDKKLIWFPLVDTSNVTNMGSMFNNCASLKEIPQFDTSKVTNMGSMFASCTSLKEVPQLNTSNVTNMSSMFASCTSLKEVPQLNTSNVTNMSSMFNNCASLKEIPQFDTSNVTNMSNMFRYCELLENVPQFDTSNVTNMSNMFYLCNKLTDTSIDNILQFCITSKIKNGKLQYLGFDSNVYPINRIKALPHYQDFLDAGWTIGY